MGDFIWIAAGWEEKWKRVYTWCWIHTSSDVQLPDCVSTQLLVKELRMLNSGGAGHTATHSREKGVEGDPYSHYGDIQDHFKDLVSQLLLNRNLLLGVS